MNTMRLVFAIAIALALLGTANAANLRRVATEIKATVADATLVDTLADKYDCRQAGATLAETLENIATKNAQARASLDIECQERTVNITAPWTRAKKTYATDFPTVKTEENERFSTAKKAADETFQTLEKERNDAVLKQEIVYSAKKELSDLAVSAYSTATSAWQKATDLKVASEKEFNDATLPDGNKINAEAFKVSNNTAAAAMNGLIATAFALRTSADALCTAAPCKLASKSVGFLRKCCLDQLPISGSGSVPQMKHISMSTGASCQSAGKGVDVKVSMSVGRQGVDVRASGAVPGS